MSVDMEFAAMVGAWEQKLGVLNQMVGSVEPPPELWDRIRTAADFPSRRRLWCCRCSAAAGSGGRRDRRADIDSSDVIRLSARPGAGAVLQLHVRDRRRAGRHHRGSGLSAGSAPGGDPAQAADANRRGEGPSVPRRRPPNTSRVAEGRRLASVHSHG